MFDKNKETRDNLNEAAKSVDEAAQEVKKVAQTVQTVKGHFLKHKTKYIIGGGVIVGTAVVGGGGFVIGRMSSPVAVSQEAKTILGLSWKPSVNVNQVQETFVLQARGNPGDVVMRVSDGARWASKNEMARDLGVARSLITQYFQGKVPDINGETFIDLGKAGHVLAVPTNPAA